MVILSSNYEDCPRRSVLFANSGQTEKGIWQSRIARLNPHAKHPEDDWRKTLTSNIGHYPCPAGKGKTFGLEKSRPCTYGAIKRASAPDLVGTVAQKPKVNVFCYFKDLGS